MTPHRAAGFFHRTSAFVLNLPGEYGLLRRVLLGFGAGIVVLLAGTAGYIHYLRSLKGNWAAGGLLKYYLIQLHLGEENVLAAWFASMLLLAVAVGAVLCFAVDGPLLKRETRRYSHWLRYGWLAIAAGFAMLSLDELGSLHERIGSAGTLDNLPLTRIDPVALPMLAAGLFMGAFVLLHLIRRPAVLAMMVFAAALLVAVPAFEHIESRLYHGASRETMLNRPVLVTLIEEGLELASTLAFLTAMVMYVVQSVRDINRVRGDQPTTPVATEWDRESTMLWMLPAITLFAVGYFLSDWVVYNMPTGDKGVPHNWFTAAPAMLVAILAFYLGAGRGRVARGLYLGLGVLCVAQSMYHGASLTFWLGKFTEDGRIRPLVEGALAAGMVCVGIGLGGLTDNRWTRLGLLVAVVMAVVGLLSLNPNAEILEAITFWVLLLALISHDTPVLTPDAKTAPRAERQPSPALPE